VHSIEPYFLWRDIYTSEEDPYALNYGKEYSELYFTNRVYNYLIHPQWDSFGSETLFYKQLFVDYSEGFCILEFIGEWNDTINNDVMLLKTELIDRLIDAGVSNFVLILENVLNFHGEIDDYYAEWEGDIDGNIYVINAQPHVLDEMDSYNLQYYLNYGGRLQDINWRSMKPEQVLENLEEKYLEEKS
jgi:hypothetical protein